MPRRLQAPPFRQFLRETMRGFVAHDIPLLAAAMSYYTVFALPALLVIALAIGGAVFGEEAARGEITAQVGNLVGERGAEAIQVMIDNASQAHTQSGWAAALGVIAFLIGATGAFVQMQNTLNRIWGVRPVAQRHWLWRLLRKRLLSFGMVMGIGFLLMVSLIVSALLAAFGSVVQEWLPPGLQGGIVETVDFMLSFSVIALLFAAIYRFLPDVRVARRDVASGAIVTALLFVVGKWMIGFYLGRASPASAYGAAGSLAIVMIWIYYSSVVVFLGALITEVVARLRGRPLIPELYAVPATAGNTQYATVASSSR